MKRYLFFLLLLGFLLSFSSRIYAMQGCSYGSTQARVQPNIQTPWAQTLTVACGQQFRVGGFHNHTGQFANDVNIQVTGPGNFNAYFQNGQYVIVPQPGIYTVTVRTNGQSGPGCVDTATVTVLCPSPTPPQPQCRYGSTQARVQHNITTPWSPHIHVGCERIFNVGSFHDGAGQFANDTLLLVSGPGIYGYFSNGQQVRIPDSVVAGTYTLQVTTQGQSGPACQESASVSFTCPTQPTPTPPPHGQQCTHASTQGRVKKHHSDPWTQQLQLSCNESFFIGSFHNFSEQYAQDTIIMVRDPYGFTAENLHNGQRIRAFFPGTYLVTVATRGQTGPSCSDVAFVQVSCDAPHIPEFWRSILQQFMVAS